MSVEYAIIVKNKTRLEALIERFNTKEQAKFYIQSSGGDFEDYEKEHDVFYSSLSLVQRHLSSVIKNKLVDRQYLPSFLFNDKHVVLTVGQDGLVANTAKYVQDSPIIAINPDKERYDGVLLPFSVDDFIPSVKSVMSGNYKYRKASFAEAKLNDGQTLLAFNDLFIGASSHISFRYKISVNDISEHHSSSGIIVSTKSGATGWLSSIFNMNSGIQNFLSRTKAKRRQYELKDNQLMYVVREPFASIRTQTTITAGILSNNNKLVIESNMPNNGIIFSDGIEVDFLKFNSGAIATIGLAKEQATLVIPN